MFSHPPGRAACSDQGCSSAVGICIFPMDQHGQPHPCCVVEMRRAKLVMPCVHTQSGCQMWKPFPVPWSGTHGQCATVMVFEGQKSSDSLCHSCAGLTACTDAELPGRPAAHTGEGACRHSAERQASRWQPGTRKEAPAAQQAAPAGAAAGEGAGGACEGHALNAEQAQGEQGHELSDGRGVWSRSVLQERASGRD